MFFRAISELVGTFMLVFFGTATIVFGSGSEVGRLIIALAFGLSLIAASYSVSRESGAHLNPAVSLAFYLNKRLTFKEFIFYSVGQFLGAFLGSFVLFKLLTSADWPVDNLGQNSVGSLGSSEAFLVEVLLTCFFVLVVMTATGKRSTQSIAGLVSGIGLIVVHLVGIPLTGTSVNPARSLAPALLVSGQALTQVWVFILAPLVGGVIAAWIGKYLLFSEN